MDVEGNGRMSALERQLASLSERIAELERRTPEGAGSPTPLTAGEHEPPAPSLHSAAGGRREEGLTPWPAPRPPDRPGETPQPAARVPYWGPPPTADPRAPNIPAAEAPARAPLSLEDLLGARVLAYAGGVAVIVGITFFVAVAIRRGWIDEPTRILLSFLGSSALLVVGVRLHERHGATEASLAAVGTAVAALFLTVAAATQLYQLFSVGFGLLIALGVGAIATGIAVRFDSRAVAGLGIVGALLSPVLVGAGTTDGALAFMAVALLSAVGVLMWRRWDWLAVAAFAVSTPQLLAWILEGQPTALALAVLAAFGALNAVAAVGYEVRVPASGLRASSTMLFLANAVVISGAGYLTLNVLGSRVGGGDGWIAGVGAVHLALGAYTLAGRRVRVAREVAILLLTAGFVLGDLAFGLAADGVLLAAGWAAASGAFAYVLGRRRHDVELLQVGLGAHVLLSLIHVLLFDANPTGFIDGFADLPSAVAALLCLAVAALVGARFVGEENATVAQALDIVGLAAVAYVSATALDGALLAAAWSAEAVALAEIGRAADDPLARRASDAFLVLAGLHALSIEAPPDALVVGVPSLGAAALALVAVGLAALRVGRLRRAPQREAFEVAAALALFYLASVTIVDGFQPDTRVLDPGIGTLDVRQQGQLLLSAFWSITGVVALVAGLSRDSRRLRLGGFGLLGLALLKVFLYDLSTLDSIYRVLSFVGLGLLLLGAAFAYQRLRPEEAATPPGSESA